MTTSEQHARAAGATDADLARPISYRDFLGYVDTLKDAIKTLKARLAEMERKGIHYTGTWQRASDYGRGAVTTHKGSAWSCVADTTRAEPGASGDWQLMVKRGDDGRDAR